MSETATRILLGFVIAGAVLLAAGVVILIWMLITGAQPRNGSKVDPAATLHLARGERIVQIARGKDDLVLLLEDADHRQVLRLIDPFSGRTMGELPVTTAP